MAGASIYANIMGASDDEVRWTRASPRRCVG
jgi:hypothetical protein